MDMTSKNERGRVIAAIVLSVSGVIFVLVLRVLEFVGETAFSSLVAFFCLVGVAVAFINRFDTIALGVTGLNAKLAKIETTKNEIAELARLTVDFVLLETEHMVSIQSRDETEKERLATINRLLEITGGEDSPVVARLHRREQSSPKPDD